MKKKIYFENLDGIRFICFLSVFFYHSFHTEFPALKQTGVYQFIKFELFSNGNLGVNFFFVLSGFLITYLLIEEKKLNGQIDLKKFWLRRVLRIWPLFYFCVIFGFYFFPFLKTLFGQQPNETASIWYYITFLNNFDFIHNGLPDASILGVLWSVAIEEQFYLFWPVLLYIFPVKKYWIVFSATIICSLTFRAFNDTPVMLEHHTLSCIGDMAVGAFGAWLITEFSVFKSKIENLKSIEILSVYLVFFFIFLFRDDLLYGNHYIRIFERSFIAIVILIIILEQNFSKKSFFKFSNYKTISSLGIITYGLYCLHFIGILITTTLTKKLGWNTQLWQVLILETLLSLMFSIIISKISFRYLESPFLRLKNKLSFINTQNIKSSSKGVHP